MGLFGIFGNKKNETINEEEQAKAAQLQKEQAVEEVKKAHEGLEWPVIARLNPVNIKDASEETMEETVTPERKDQIGNMIYDEDISPDSLKFLSGQELLFLLTALEIFHKKAPLPEFERNHRKVYNEVLSRIRDAEYLYVLYDQTTGFPFIDHGFANVYFEQELAEKAAALFNKQFRRLVARKILVEDKQDTTGKKVGFFDYLYYVGIENIIIDNGAYRARFKRNEIVAAPGEWNQGDQPQMPINPGLNFAMLDFLEEVRWPVKYEKREEILKAKEMRMLSYIRAAQFIVPMQHDGPVEALEDGRLKLTKDNKIRFLVMKTTDDKQFIPVFTDAFEFAKLAKTATGWNAGVFRYQDILKFVQDKDGIRINPDGQGLVLTKDRMMALEMAGQQAEMLHRKDQVGKAAASSADGAVQQALNQAMAKMKEEDK